MLDSIYIGMSGLTSFSKGLSNISNNVANLNTTGFKGSELEFSDLFYQYQYAGTNAEGQSFNQGSGVKAGESFTKFTQGDFRQTGNDLDVAVDGNGFFIINKDNKTFYTRDGQFAIDSNGFLTTRDDGSKVSGVVNGNLTDINISGKRSNPAKQTDKVVFGGALSTGDQTFNVSNVTVFDSLGKQHTLTLNLTNNTANVSGDWTFTVKEGSAVLASGDVKYDGSGSPSAGFEQFKFTFAPGGGATSTQVTLDFSGTNAFSSSASSLNVQSQNGYAAGFLSKTTIDTDGYLVLSYSNGQTLKASQLGLATFGNLNALESVGGNRYQTHGQVDRSIGAPGERSLGKLKVNGVELSNVDLAKEFSELIIVQRGYQASSQVISAANEMIQQLGEIRGRK